MLIAAFATLPLCAQSQEKETNHAPSKFGFTAGFIESAINPDNKTNSPSPFWDPVADAKGSGLFVGITFDQELSEDFSLSSEFFWARSNVEQFRLGTYLNYRLFNSKFRIMAGPELNYISQGGFDYQMDYGNRLGVNLTGGLEYDINNRISVYGKYSYELTDRYKGGVNEEYYEDGFKGFRLGIKFRF